MSSSSNSGLFAFPMILAWLPLLMIILDDDPDMNVRNSDTQKIAAMSAEDASEAVGLGMKPSLAPYFAACQAEQEITAGVSEGVTIEQADAVISCMEDAKSDGLSGDGTNLDWPNEGEKWNAFLKASMSAPSFEFSYNLGIVSQDMEAHFDNCQIEHEITAGDSRDVTIEQASAMLNCLKANIQP